MPFFKVTLSSEIKIKKINLKIIFPKKPDTKIIMRERLVRILISSQLVNARLKNNEIIKE